MSPEQAIMWAFRESERRKAEEEQREKAAIYEFFKLMRASLPPAVEDADEQVDIAPCVENTEKSGRPTRDDDGRVEERTENDDDASADSEHEAAFLDEGEEFQRHRKKWPDEQRWSHGKHVDEQEATQGPEPRSPVPVEWDKILDQEPAGELAPSSNRRLVTVKGALVVVAVGAGSALIAAALGRALRRSGHRDLPWWKDWRVWLNAGLGVGVAIIAQRSKNHAIRTLGTTVGASYAAGALTTGIIEDHQAAKAALAETNS